MERQDVNPNVDFLYKTMLHRDPKKRRVKPVQNHLIQVDFGEDDSDDDSDFDLKNVSSDSNEEKEVEAESNEDEVGEAGDKGEESDDSEAESEEESSSESESDSTEDEKPGKRRNLFDMIDSDDEDDEEYIPNKKKKQRNTEKQAEHPVEKQRIKSPEISKLKGENPLSEVQSSRPMKVLICCVCLGDIRFGTVSVCSEDDDEIVECDNCGVAVHEGCYGISDNQSAASTESSASTEPWFCDACKAGVKPDCELCPNEGGIFKETDAGKWVHLVCALYTPGVAFGDVDKLSPVTLFEMPYARWGHKECSLCEDSRFCTTGVCISCDAGMCRSYFHVTCAQREGLLSEASPEEVMDIADPFFAYCKLHADKNATRAKRRNWLAIQSHVRQHAQADIDDEKEKTRFQRKLNRHRQKYLVAKAKRPPAWVPTQKMSRYLTSSPSVVKKMLRKAELMGIITQSHHVPHTKQENNSRKKSHIPPGFSTDFVTHFVERTNRIANLKGTLKELMNQNEKLRDQERILRTQYDMHIKESEKFKESVSGFRKEGEKIWTILSAISGQTLKLPEILVQKKQARPQTRRELPMSPPAIINQCGLCCKTHDQHLLARCDKCRLWYHLGCLDPPLTRMPKKTSRQGWQCSGCVRSSSDDSDNSSVNVNAPRRLREKIKEPAKFTTSQELEFLFPNMLSSARRGRKKKGRNTKMEAKEKPAEDVESKNKNIPVTSEPAEVIKEVKEVTPMKVKTEPAEVKDITPIKVKAEPFEDISRTGRRRIKKKRYDSDDDTITPPKQSKTSEKAKTPVKKSPVKEDSTDRDVSTAVKDVKKEITVLSCTICSKDGEKTTMVSCDECQLWYHFICLNPPFKKTPKQRGYTWFCEACDHTDNEEDDEDSKDETTEDLTNT